jgi:hypothetical protein
VLVLAPGATVGWPGVEVDVSRVLRYGEEREFPTTLEAQGEVIAVVARQVHERAVCVAHN